MKLPATYLFVYFIKIVVNMTWWSRRNINHIVFMIVLCQAILCLICCRLEEQKAMPLIMKEQRGKLW